MSRRIACLALLALTLPAASHPAQFAIDPQHSQVTARVGFFGIGSRTAAFPRVSGAIMLPGGDAVRLDVRVDATALRASDRLTESRLKGDKFFDVDRYPVVIFTGQSMTRTGPQSALIVGTITARGVTRPASLNVRFSHAIESVETTPVHISATTEIDRRDYGMTAYSLIVGRRVAIAIEADLQPAS